MSSPHVLNKPLAVSGITGHKVLSLASKRTMTLVCIHPLQRVACALRTNTSASESRQVAADIWIVLKTLLFTIIMLSQSILSTITYSRPVSSAAVPAPLLTHSSLALSTLRTLSQLSFVITKFGGVTSTSSDGFAELKRVFYSALDVLSADVRASEIFVKALNPFGSSMSVLFHYPFADLPNQVGASSSVGEPPSDPLTRARQAFNLACVEQLVPLLSLNTIEYSVFPLCLPCA